MLKTLLYDPVLFLQINNRIKIFFVACILFSSKCARLLSIVFYQSSSINRAVLLVLSELVSTHIRIDTNKMKGELELNKKYIICEELGRSVHHVSHYSMNIFHFLCDTI